MLDISLVSENQIKQQKRNLFPFLNIQDLLLKLENFRYATSLDLTMGHIHITLCPVAQKLCTIASITVGQI